jgi:hypothetical protein
MADHVNPKLNGRMILKRANHGLNHPIDHTAGPGIKIAELEREYAYADHLKRKRFGPIIQ